MTDITFSDNVLYFTEYQDNGFNNVHVTVPNEIINMRDFGFDRNILRDMTISESKKIIPFVTSYMIEQSKKYGIRLLSLSLIQEGGIIKVYNYELAEIL